MKLLFKWFTVLEILGGSCIAQLEAAQLGPWDSSEGTFDYNSNHYIRNDVQNEDAIREEINYDDVGLDYETQSSEDDDNIRDYIINKRSAQERRTRGKIRKAEKHNKRVIENELGLQNNVTKDTILESNLTFQRPKTIGGKYSPKRKSKLRDNKSAPNLKSSMSVNRGSEDIEKDVIPGDAKFYASFPEVKESLNKDFVDKEIKGSPVLSKNISVNDFSNKNIHLVSKDMRTSGMSKDSYSVKSKKSYRKKFKFNSIKQPDDAISDNKIKITEKRFKKHKNMNGKAAHSVKSENLEHDDERYTENLKQNNLNKQIVQTHNAENGQKYGLDYHPGDTNISLINQGFLGAVEKRYFKNLLSYDNSLNDKSKAELLDSLSKNKYFNEVLGRTNWKFTNQRINENEKENSNIDDYSAKLINILEKEPFSNSVNKNEEESIDEKKENVLEYTNPKTSTDTVPLYNKKEDSKVNIHNDHVMELGILNEKNDSTTISPQSGHVVAAKAKHKSRESKKVRGKELRDNNELPDKDREAPFYRLMDGIDTKKLEHTKRHERDLNNIFKTNNYVSRKHAPIDTVGFESNSEDTDKREDRTQEEELIPDDVNDADEEERKNTQSHQKAHKLRDGERYLKYSHHSKNKNDVEEDKFISDEDYKKLHARRAHESGFNGDECMSTDSCVEYKANQESNDTELFTTTEKIRFTYSTKRNSNVKIKTTPTVSNRSMSPTKNYSESERNSTYSVEISDYEQYLCGQLANTYVNAVLIKVHRSKKMLKELGFSNETEESCDRCIETKSNKIPDLETMKATLGKCLKGDESTQNYSRCYGIPKSMDIFLNVLLSFGKEHENSVYNKIQDDSSFIFTGDYSDSIIRSDKLSMNNKYISDRDIFSKDSFEKQHLREEGNEEKGDDQVLSKTYFENVKRVSPSEEIKHEDTTEVIEDGGEEQSDQKDLETRENQRDDIKNKEHEGEHSEQHSLQSDENLKGDLIDVFDTQDSISQARHKYSNFKDSDGCEAFDVNSLKLKRKFQKKDKLRNIKNDYNREFNTKDGKYTANQPHKKRNYNEFNSYPDKRSHILHTHYSGVVDDPHSVSKTIQHHGETWQRYHNPFQIDGSRPHSENNNDHFPRTALAGSELSKYDKTNNYFGYAPHGYIVNNRISQNKNNKPNSFPNSLSNNVENVEYQLYPNQLGENERDNSLNMMAPAGNFKNYYSDSQRMDKREADPYEDEVIFFEIPDIEYELY